MAEQFVRLGPINLCYETFGYEGDEPLVLIAGLGAQMLSWESEFCDRLAAEGFWVIRFDNRDSGRSTHMSGSPDFVALLKGQAVTPVYGLDVLADDVVRLLEALQITRAHIVGASMGAMVAQLVAIHYGQRVLSLASIMSTTGNSAVGQPTPEATAALLAPVDTAEQAITRRRVWQSPAYPATDDELAARSEASRLRDGYGSGTERQLAAILSAPDRSADLRSVRVPTLVIHGDQDTLIDVSGGQATAAAIDDAQLLIFPGMGHDLPRALWVDVVAAIAANARRARD